MTAPTAPHPAALRALLDAVILTDSDLTAVCQDYFPDVAKRFTDNMNRVAKVNLLLALVKPQAVLAALQQYDPELYAQHAQLLTPAAGSSSNPYRGLSAFQANESHLFFGRDALTEKLWQRFNALYEQAGATRLLAILGPSGSGKSSVARAGLLAALRERPISGSHQMRSIVLKPGEHPIRALALALRPAPSENASSPDLGAQRKLIDDLGQPNKGGEFDGLTLWAANLPGVDTSPLVALVDQFEEVYTLCTDKSERDAFVGLLRHAASDTARHVAIVLTLRSDFLGETHRQHPELNRLIGEQEVIVTAMSRAELTEAIAKPAEQAGQPINDATVQLLLSQSWGSEGALPLLEFALTRIWEGMQAQKEASATLIEIGGVGGAMAGKAQEIFDKLDEPAQKTAHRALVRLVRLGEGTRDTRRRAPISELFGRNESEEFVLSVLRKFSTEHARLVTLAVEGGETLAEVTHEALFDHWEKLRTWIEESRKDRGLYDRALEAAKLWNRDGKPAGRLWRPPDLDLLRDYQRREPDDFGPLVAEFLGAAQRRQKTELALSLGAVAAVVAALLIAAGIYVAKERQRTRDASIAQMLLYHQLLASYVEKGSQLLFENGKPSEGLLWLHRAKKEGSPDPALPDLLKSAMQAADATKAVLIGHGASVWSATYSPDGRRIVTSSFDKTARVWEVEGGRMLAELKGHSASVWRATFSPDGHRILTASDDKTARVWDAEGGRLLAELKGYNATINSATFSPDGRRILTASVDNTARVWDAEGGRMLAELKGHESNVVSATFSSDGLHILTASWDKTARVWDAEDGRLLAELKGHGASVYSATYSPDGLRIVTASSDKTARVWDAEGGRLLAELKGHGASVNSATYSPDGRRIVTASSDKTARVWEAEGGRLLAELKGHGASVVSATFSPDGRRIVTASADSTARMWEAEGGQLLAELKGHGDGVLIATFSPNGRNILTASFDNTARVWEAEGSRLLAELKGHRNSVWSATHSPDGRRIVTASFDKTARVWESDGGRLLAELKGHGNSVVSARYSPDGRRIVTASFDKTARVWEADGGRLLAELKGHGDSVVSARYSPDGRRIVTASFDKTARVWESDGGRLLAELKGHRDSVDSATYSPDGRRILTASSDKTARVWESEGGRLLAELKGHRDSVLSATYSPDGRRIVTASSDNSARLWESEGGRLLAELNGHGDSVNSAIFSPDGRRILTASADSTARVWEAEGGRLLAELKGHGDGIISATYSPDGRRIVTASSDKTARVWEADGGRLLAVLRGHGNRVFSAMYSPDGRRVVTASSDMTARVWDLSPETRSSQQLAKLIRCHVPLRFDQEGSRLIVFRMPTPAECQNAP